MNIPFHKQRSRQCVYSQQVFSVSSCFLLSLTGANAKVIFSTYGGGPRGIYVMDDDGSNVTLLTDQGRPSLPRWAPDGKSIVFNRYVNDSISLMNADGSGIREITVPPKDAEDSFPAFHQIANPLCFRGV